MAASAESHSQEVVCALFRVCLEDKWISLECAARKEWVIYLTLGTTENSQFLRENGLSYLNVGHASLCVGGGTCRAWCQCLAIRDPGLRYAQSRGVRGMCEDGSSQKQPVLHCL